jgi:HK97 family phage portal protein
VTILKRAAINWFGSTPPMQRDPGMFWETGGTTADSGIHVGHESAMTFSAVYASVSLISDSIASLPADVYARYPNNTRYVKPKPSWLARPNPEMTWGDVVQQMVTSLLLGGNSYSGCVYDRAGVLAELWPIDPRIVVPQRNAATRDLEYVVSGKPVTPREILHIRGITLPGYLHGLSPVEAARQTIGLGLGAEKHGAKQMANSATPSVIVSVDGKVDDEQADRFSARFMKHHAGLDNAGKPITIGGGAKITQLTMTNDQLQFLETRKFQVSDVARWFRVPPHMIGDIENSTSWGTGIEQQNIMFVQHTLTPWIVRIEKALSPFVPPTDRGIETYLKMNTNALMRGDMEARADYMSRKIEHGAARPQDWNALDDENPLPGGDKLWMSQNLQALDENGVPITDPPAKPPVPLSK